MTIVGIEIIATLFPSSSDVLECFLPAPSRTQGLNIVLCHSPVASPVEVTQSHSVQRQHPPPAGAQKSWALRRSTVSWTLGAP